MSISVTDKKVTIGHNTTLKNGDKVALHTTFDFTKCTPEQILKWAGADQVIAWRNKTGIKDLSTDDAKKLDNQVVDCSAIVERIKKVETPEQKQLREAITRMVSKGKNIADIMSALRALEEEEMESGETTE